MRDQKLIEKHAAAAGPGNIKVNWTRLGGGAAAANEALFSGAVDPPMTLFEFEMPRH